MMKVNHGQWENPERTVHFLGLAQAKMAVLNVLADYTDSLFSLHRMPLEDTQLAAGR
jgi:hypothetical protein